ncbi:zinc finger protein 692 [Trichomycterus rosablanca]|uniref:zinc finger protein 692 n=1 Tax=Trichomycterus rosablanca TaxID=2290929 RepID=UPI002F35E7E8
MRVFLLKTATVERLVGPTDPDEIFCSKQIVVLSIMESSKAAQRKQRRRELDARRSKYRVRLGSWPESWSTLKERLGFSNHSELAEYLLNSYSSKLCSRCSGNRKDSITVTLTSLRQLVMLVHDHAQQCPQTPNLQIGAGWHQLTGGQEVSETEVNLKITCDGGDTFTWCPKRPDNEAGGEADQVGGEESGPIDLSEQKVRRKGVKGAGVGTTGQRRQDEASDDTTRLEKEDEAEQNLSENNKDAEQPEQETQSQEGSDAGRAIRPPKISYRRVPGDISVVPNLARRRRRAGQPEEPKPDSMGQDRRISKPSLRLILPCEFDGCWKTFSSRRYLNHHMKYQHFQQRMFVCTHQSCGKSFNFKKHLKEHEKLHSDQKDYICEFCARAFRTSSNLRIHRRIHTGEKPLQCEVCGFTCRQKASLNWHMRKHDAEQGYRFQCDVCGRRFEKRDNVTAHRSKSHTHHMTSDLPEDPTIA